MSNTPIKQSPIKIETVTVSADALRQVLLALMGPGHYIRELQATRGPLVGVSNPINILIAEYNAAMKVIRESQPPDLFPCPRGD